MEDAPAVGRRVSIGSLLSLQTLTRFDTAQDDWPINEDDEKGEGSEGGTRGERIEGSDELSLQKSESNEDVWTRHMSSLQFNMARLGTSHRSPPRVSPLTRYSRTNSQALDRHRSRGQLRPTGDCDFSDSCSNDSTASAEEVLRTARSIVRYPTHKDRSLTQTPRTPRQLSTFMSLLQMQSRDTSALGASTLGAKADMDRIMLGVDEVDDVMELRTRLRDAHYWVKYLVGEMEVSRQDNAQVDELSGNFEYEMMKMRKERDDATNQFVTLMKDSVEAQKEINNIKEKYDKVNALYSAALERLKEMEEKERSSSRNESEQHEGSIRPSCPQEQSSHSLMELIEVTSALKTENSRLNSLLEVREKELIGAKLKSTQTMSRLDTTSAMVGYYEKCLRHLYPSSIVDNTTTKAYNDRSPPSLPRTTGWMTARSETNPPSTTKGGSTQLSRLIMRKNKRSEAIRRGEGERVSEPRIARSQSLPIIVKSPKVMISGIKAPLVTKSRPYRYLVPSVGTHNATQRHESHEGDERGETDRTPPTSGREHAETSRLNTLFVVFCPFELLRSIYLRYEDVMSVQQQIVTGVSSTSESENEELMGSHSQVEVSLKRGYRHRGTRKGTYGASREAGGSVSTAIVALASHKPRHSSESRSKKHDHHRLRRQGSKGRQSSSQHTSPHSRHSHPRTPRQSLPTEQSSSTTRPKLTSSQSMNVATDVNTNQSHESPSQRARFASYNHSGSPPEDISNSTTRPSNYSSTPQASSPHSSRAPPQPSRASPQPSRVSPRDPSCGRVSTMETTNHAKRTILGTTTQHLTPLGSPTRAPLSPSAQGEKPVGADPLPPPQLGATLSPRPRFSPHTPTTHPSPTASPQTAANMTTAATQPSTPRGLPQTSASPRVTQVRTTTTFKSLFNKKKYVKTIVAEQPYASSTSTSDASSIHTSPSRTSLNSRPSPRRRTRSSRPSLTAPFALISTPSRSSRSAGSASSQIHLDSYRGSIGIASDERVFSPRTLPKIVMKDTASTKKWALSPH
eukprot:GHVN01013115.1.p1 GENE.GHVN01013115.1~~GHVN01013115.1.p1  ORF type:complete len:1023 (+),score=218.77 GHVN01013115.1:185-3253(+)